MQIRKITPFLLDIKTFFMYLDIATVIQSISSILSMVRTTERVTDAVRSKRNCVYPPMDVFRRIAFSLVPIIRHATSV